MNSAINRSCLLVCLFAIVIITAYQHGIYAQRNQELLSWYDMGILMEASFIDSTDYPIFLDYLDESGEDPEDYIVKKCKEHQIVILGEMHHQRETQLFFHDIIPRLYHEADIRYVILEVPLVTHNDKLERLVTGKIFDQDLAMEIIRGEGFSDWGDKEYWEILKTVWNLNQRLPEDRDPMRLIGVEIHFDFKLNKLWEGNKLDDEKLIDQAESQRPLLYKRDELMAAAIEQYVLDNKGKGIVLVGANHSFTHYAQPRFITEKLPVPKTGNNKKPSDYMYLWPRMANILYQKHGDKIFQILIHSSLRKAGIRNKYNGTRHEPVLTEVIEGIMSYRNNKPIGFDVFDSPFGLLRDSHVNYFHYQSSVKMSDISRGYIFLEPLENISFSTWLDGFISEELYISSIPYREYYDKLYYTTWENVQEIDEWYRKSWEEFNEK